MPTRAASGPAFLEPTLHEMISHHTMNKYYYKVQIRPIENPINF